MCPRSGRNPSPPHGFCLPLCATAAQTTEEISLHPFGPTRTKVSASVSFYLNLCLHFLKTDDNCMPADFYVVLFELF